MVNTTDTDTLRDANGSVNLEKIMDKKVRDKEIDSERLQNHEKELNDEKIFFDYYASISTESMRGRIEFAKGAIKTVTLLNSGAILAILAFMGKIWGTANSYNLISGFVAPIRFFMYGAVCALFLSISAYFYQSLTVHKSQISVSKKKAGDRKDSNEVEKLLHTSNIYKISAKFFLITSLFFLLSSTMFFASGAYSSIQNFSSFSSHYQSIPVYTEPQVTNNRVTVVDTPQAKQERIMTIQQILEKVAQESALKR